MKKIGEIKAKQIQKYQNNLRDLLFMSIYLLLQSFLQKLTLNELIYNRLKKKYAFQIVTDFIFNNFRVDFKKQTNNFAHASGIFNLV